jgi:hypothetical protein
MTEGKSGVDGIRSDAGTEFRERCQEHFEIVDGAVGSYVDIARWGDGCLLGNGGEDAGNQVSDAKSVERCDVGGGVKTLCSRRR